MILRFYSCLVLELLNLVISFRHDHAESKNRPHRIRYKLHKMLGPVKIPSQKTMLPNVARLRSHFVRLSLTNYRHSKSAS